MTMTTSHMFGVFFSNPRVIFPHFLSPLKCKSNEKWPEEKKGRLYLNLRFFSSLTRRSHLPLACMYICKKDHLHFWLDLLLSQKGWPQWAKNWKNSAKCDLHFKGDTKWWKYDTWIRKENALSNNCHQSMHFFTFLQILVHCALDHLSNPQLHKSTFDLCKILLT